MKKQLKEELKRFKQILNYNLSGKDILNEDVELNTEVSYVPREIVDLVEEVGDMTPISKSEHTYESASLIQAILVDSGYCVHGKTCDYIDGDFGDTTAASLEDFIGKTSLKNKDLDTLEDEMTKKVTEEGKSYVGTKEKYNDSIKRRDKKFRKMGIHLEYLTPEMASYFRKWYGHNKALNVGGQDIEQDMVNYIAKKEGGMSDAKTDRAHKKNMPYEYDTENKILTYKGKKYKLSGKDLPEKTKSKRYGSRINPSYSSDLWHTNRGVMWDYFKDKGGKPDSLDTIKDWLNFSEEDLYDYYMDNYYNDKYSNNDLINHFFALVRWGSGNASKGPDALEKILLNKFDTSSIDETIEKVGLPVFFDVMVKERGNQFLSIMNPNNPSKPSPNRKGWMNSLVNFHYYFYEKYIKPIADQVPDKVSDEIVDVITQPGIDDEIDMVVDLPQVTITTSKNRGGGGTMWFDPDDFKSKKDTIIPNIYGREIDIKKGDIVPDHLRNDDDDF